MFRYEGLLTVLFKLAVPDELLGVCVLTARSRASKVAMVLPY